MIQEAYCSYEISKLLKEKGFDEPCVAYYYVMPHRTVISYDKSIPKNSDLSLVHAFKEFGSLPTHQMVLAWLREVHNIFIEIGTSIDLNGNYHFRYTILDKECRYVRKGYTDFDWNYEDAVEAAIKYCLENLI